MLIVGILDIDCNVHYFDSLKIKTINDKEITCEPWYVPEDIKVLGFVLADTETGNNRIYKVDRERQSSYKIGKFFDFEKYDILNLVIIRKNFDEEYFR